MQACHARHTLQRRDASPLVAENNGALERVSHKAAAVSFILLPLLLGELASRWARAGTRVVRGYLLFCGLSGGPRCIAHSGWYSEHGRATSPNPHGATATAHLSQRHGRWGMIRGEVDDERPFLPLIFSPSSSSFPSSSATSIATFLPLRGESPPPRSQLRVRRAVASTASSIARSTRDPRTHPRRLRL